MLKAMLVQGFTGLLRLADASFLFVPSCVCKPGLTRLEAIYDGVTTSDGTLIRTAAWPYKKGTKDSSVPESVVIKVAALAAADKLFGAPDFTNACELSALLPEVVSSILAQAHERKLVKVMAGEQPAVVVKTISRGKRGKASDA